MSLLKQYLLPSVFTSIYVVNAWFIGTLFLVKRFIINWIYRIQLPCQQGILTPYIKNIFQFFKYLVSGLVRGIFWTQKDPFNWEPIGQSVTTWQHHVVCAKLPLGQQPFVFSPFPQNIKGVFVLSIQIARCWQQICTVKFSSATSGYKAGNGGSVKKQKRYLEWRELIPSYTYHWSLCTLVLWSDLPSWLTFSDLDGGEAPGRKRIYHSLPIHPVCFLNCTPVSSFFCAWDRGWVCHCHIYFGLWIWIFPTIHFSFCQCAKCSQAWQHRQKLLWGLAAQVASWHTPTRY